MVFAPPPGPPWGEDHKFCNFDAPLGNDACDNVWLKLALWFLRRCRKCKKSTNDDRQNTIAKLMRPRKIKLKAQR